MPVWRILWFVQSKSLRLDQQWFVGIGRRALHVVTPIFEQDRLPAFFGFASFYAQSVGASIQTDYFAGLWSKSLHEDMLWRIDSSVHKLQTRGNRLCCCFDSTYSSDRNWRCQYSYSAAYSLACLDQRRLCRYGKLDAAVPYHLEFMGSCSGESSCSGENTLTSIRQLRELWAANLLQDGKEPYLGPRGHGYQRALVSNI